MQQSIQKLQHKVLGRKHLVKRMLKKYYLIFFFILLQACNTVTGTIEGTALGIVKDVKSTYHYTTCVFTDATCGDLDLD